MQDLLFFVAALALIAGCEEGMGLHDDPVRFVDDGDYRRAILERDLLSLDNDYAQARLRSYGPGREWDALQADDPFSGPVTDAVVEALRSGEDPWSFVEGTHLVPDALPSTPRDWSALGERVLFEYPMYADRDATRAAKRGFLERIGFRQADGVWIGLRLVDTAEGPGLALTCAACHASVDPQGQRSAVRANHAFEVGRLRLVRHLDDDGELPADVSLGWAESWRHLGPGRSDVLDDAEPNAYAFPDFGGIVDMPYLHHTANWIHTGTATLAVRIETVFMGRDTLTAESSLELGRVPRVLAWAMAEHLRSLPPPRPNPGAPGPSIDRGRDVFEASGCPGCHRPPTYTSDELVELDVVGTDPSAGLSRSRFTGYYRIPSLRGVGSAGPLLHDGSVESLQEMFDPDRSTSGHRWGLDLDIEDRDALVSFLRSI